MKKILFLFLSGPFVFQAIGQGDWIELKYPSSGIIGRAVKNINKGNLTWDPASDNSDIKIKTLQSVENIAEYNGKFRSFLASFLKSESAKISEVSAKKLMIHSIDVESIARLTVGGKYVYEGLCADSVVVTLSQKSDLKLNLDDIVKKIGDAIGVPASDLSEKIIPIVDSSAYNRTNNIYYKITIANPEVYFKVRIVYLLERKPSRGSSYEDIWVLFSKNGIKDSSLVLKVDATGINSETDEISPYSGDDEQKSVRYKIALKKDTTGLRLYLYGRLPDFNNNWTIIKEIPFVMEGDKKIWKQDRELINTFTYLTGTKKVYVRVTAMQLNANTIEIICWRVKRNSYNNAYSFIQYPETSFHYLRKKDF